jgi:hypothetical protein
MKAINIGSSFDVFLVEEAMLEDTNAVADRRVAQWKNDQELKVKMPMETSTDKMMGASCPELDCHNKSLRNK